jgi:hypothetical protein
MIGAVGALLMGSGVAMASGPLPAGTLFLCDEGEPYVQVLVPSGQNANPILLLGSEQIEMEPTPVASGYGAELSLGPHHWMVHGKGADSLLLMKDDEAPKQCKVTSTSSNSAETSGEIEGNVSSTGNFALGGNVRSGPGIQNEKIDSLAYGEPIAIVSRTDVQYEGYEWYEIEYGEGQSGFMWGGIMCSNALHIAGLYENCPADLN